MDQALLAKLTAELPARKQAEDALLAKAAVDPAALSPAEAREAGLVLVRRAYARGYDYVAPVKALQKKWRVKKFYDIPIEKGHEFYQQASQL